MRKKPLVTAVVLITLVPLAFPLVGAEKANKQMTIGVVIPHETGWFAAFKKGFEVVANAENVKILWQYSNHKFDDETKAVQNLITLGVDGINLTAATPASAEYSCRLANEARIPVQVAESGIAEGEGKPVAEVDISWVEVYRTVARSLRKDVPGDLSVVWIQGTAGTPSVERAVGSFKNEITKLKGIKLAADVRYGDCVAAKSLDVMKNIVESGVQFNVVIGACQEATDGIIRALKEENLDLSGVSIVTVGGGSTDIENFKKGDLDYCISLSPGLHGMICAQNLISHLKGQTYHRKSYSPIVWCNAKDWSQKLIPWDVDEKWMPVVNEFMGTGRYKPELKKS